MSNDRVYKVLLGPHVSEKATLATELRNQVVFKVVADATKPEVKEAVEALFDVKVDSVQMVNLKGKSKRTARGLGRRKGVRKAYVRLSDGHSIDFVDVE